ncbi:hypothetical protein LguiB_013855 [Lonicera macranthoides]
MFDAGIKKDEGTSKGRCLADTIEKLERYTASSPLEGAVSSKVKKVISIFGGGHAQWWPLCKDWFAFAKNKIVHGVYPERVTSNIVHDPFNLESEQQVTMNDVLQGAGISHGTS